MQKVIFREINHDYQLTSLMDEVNKWIGPSGKIVSLVVTPKYVCGDSYSSGSIFYSIVMEKQ